MDPVTVWRRSTDLQNRDDKDHYLGLLKYRNTPVDNFKSPPTPDESQDMINPFNLRSHLSTYTEVGEAYVSSDSYIYYNRSAKPLTPLTAGTNIRFHQEDGSWQQAKVIQSANTPRSYHLQTDEGHLFWHNRQHLCETNKNPNEFKNQQFKPNHCATSVLQPELDQKPPELTPNYHYTYTTRSGRAVKPRQILDL